MGRLRLLFVMAGCIKISALVLIFFVCASYERPQFNLGSIFTNGIGAAFNTAIGRDCKGRAQGDYFYGCQVKMDLPRYFWLFIAILPHYKCYLVCGTLQYW